MSRVAVIDYGMGNLHSVANALRFAGAAQVDVTHDAALIAQADHVVFPGVGAMRDCMAEIRAMGCDVLLRDVLQRGTPVLAICVGMQSLFERSEENGGVDCLAWFKGQVRHFGTPLLDEHGQRLKVPHMGWNELQIIRDHPLWHGIADRTRFYFVHSFYVDAADRDIVVAQADYGPRIDAAVAHNNLFAVQFHPEKSQTAGLALLKNFLAWNGQSH